MTTNFKNIQNIEDNFITSFESIDDLESGGLLFNGCVLSEGMKEVLKDDISEIASHETILMSISKEKDSITFYLRKAELNKYGVGVIDLHEIASFNLSILITPC